MNKTKIHTREREESNMVQGKRRRCKRFHPPTVREAKGEFENYGIITSYNGGAGRYTTVQYYSYADASVAQLEQVRMKGSITPPKCRQRIAVGSFVLLQYGELALIYKDSSMIPPHIVMALEGAVNEVEEAARGRKKDTIDDADDDFSDDDLSEADGTDSDDNSNPDFI